MKFLLLTIALICFLTSTNAQYHLLVTPKVYVSQGLTYNNDVYTGTLGLHYFFTSYYGNSIQTNFIRDLGWYQDFGLLKGDFKLIGSIGYSVNYNAISYSVRIGCRLNMFKY